MHDLPTAAAQIADFLKLLTTTGGLRLKYRIVAGAGAADPDGLEDRLLYVDLSGPDAELLLDRDGEVLRALEHVAARIVGLEMEEHDRISFDALGFKAEQAASLRAMADEGVRSVREENVPFRFEPMSSRERRLLHLLLKRQDGLRTESSGEGARRSVVLYANGMASMPEPRVLRPHERGAGAGNGRDGRFVRDLAGKRSPETGARQMERDPEPEPASNPERGPDNPEARLRAEEIAQRFRRR